MTGPWLSENPLVSWIRWGANPTPPTGGPWAMEIRPIRPTERKTPASPLGEQQETWETWCAGKDSNLHAL